VQPLNNQGTSNSAKAFFMSPEPDMSRGRLARGFAPPGRAIQKEELDGSRPAGASSGRDRVCGSVHLPLVETGTESRAEADFQPERIGLDRFEPDANGVGLAHRILVQGSNRLPLSIGVPVEHAP